MGLNTDRHMDEDEIERYSMGSMTEEESARFDEHLFICELCRNRVAKSDDYVAAMQGASLRLRRPPKPSRVRFFSRPVTFFPVLGLIVLAGLVSLWLGRRVAATPPFAVYVAATRGAGIDAKAPRGRPLILNLELSGLAALPSFRVEMVDRVGAVVWSGTAQSRDAKAEVSVPGMSGGVYFVRVYGSSGKLLREYGIEIQ